MFFVIFPGQLTGFKMLSNKYVKQLRKLRVPSTSGHRAPTRNFPRYAECVVKDETDCLAASFAVTVLVVPLLVHLPVYLRRFVTPLLAWCLRWLWLWLYLVWHQKAVQ